MAPPARSNSCAKFVQNNLEMLWRIIYIYNKSQGCCLSSL